jgi:hypothetical protein
LCTQLVTQGVGQSKFRYIHPANRLQFGPTFVRIAPQKLSVRTDRKKAFCLKRQGNGKNSLLTPFKEYAMRKFAKSALNTGESGTDRGRGHRRDGPSVEEAAEEEDGLDLPVDPDEGMPLIPDDERVIEVPS